MEHLLCENWRRASPSKIGRDEREKVGRQLLKDRPRSLSLKGFVNLGEDTLPFFDLGFGEAAKGGIVISITVFSFDELVLGKWG